MKESQRTTAWVVVPAGQEFHAARKVLGGAAKRVGLDPQTKPESISVVRVLLVDVTPKDGAVAENVTKAIQKARENKVKVVALSQDPKAWKGKGLTAAPVAYRPAAMAGVVTEVSEALTAALRKRGGGFIKPLIVMVILVGGVVWYLNEYGPNLPDWLDLGDQQPERSDDDDDDEEPTPVSLEGLEHDADLLAKAIETFGGEAVSDEPPTYLSLFEAAAGFDSRGIDLGGEENERDMLPFSEVLKWYAGQWTPRELFSLVHRQPQVVSLWAPFEEMLEEHDWIIQELKSARDKDVVTDWQVDLEAVIKSGEVEGAFISEHLMGVMPLLSHAQAAARRAAVHGDFEEMLAIYEASFVLTHRMSGANSVSEIGLAHEITRQLYGSLLSLALEGWLPSPVLSEVAALLEASPTPEDSATTLVYKSYGLFVASLESSIKQPAAEVPEDLSEYFQREAQLAAEIYRQLAEAAEAPLLEAETRVDEIISEVRQRFFEADYERLDEGSMLNLALPNLGYFLTGYLATQASRNATRLGIEIVRFEQENGRFSHSLDELGDDAQRFLDPFAERPLRYRAPSEEDPLPRLYSVGGNRRDDGGDSSLDLIYFPPPSGGLLDDRYQLERAVASDAFSWFARQDSESTYDMAWSEDGSTMLPRIGQYQVRLEPPVPAQEVRVVGYLWPAPRIRSLTLGGVERGISTEWLEVLEAAAAAWPNVEHLVASELDPQELDVLASFPRLRHLEITELTVIDHDELRDETLEVLAALPHLERLTLLGAGSWEREEFGDALSEQLPGIEVIYELD